MDTVVALATPPGNSGVAIIRISGEGAYSILQKLTKSKQKFIPRYMYLKKIYFKNASDDALVVFFAAPNSYTGEDVVEIHAHGGYHLAQMIIDACLQFGATMAGAGEFSKRAFLNGKLTLDQAEGIMDIINAESDMQISMGSKLLNGQLVEIIANQANKLTDIIAEIEAKLDYPEYEFSAQETSNVQQNLAFIIDDLRALLNTSKNGQIIKNGVKVALVGAPNVGKSSLLNALTNTNKAIVTEIAGTTRDVIDAEYQFNGIIFRLFDTAGIHESADKVEQIGIERAKQTLNDADIVLLISDSDNICTLNTPKPIIKVFNKSDLYTPTQHADTTNKTKTTNKNVALHNTLDGYIYVSALTGENLDKLKQQIFDLTVNKQIDGNAFYLTNARHIQCVSKAIELLLQAKQTFATTTLDITANLLKSAWQSLGEITGVTSDEAIIDRIFSKFCLGK